MDRQRKWTIHAAHDSQKVLHAWYRLNRNGESTHHCGSPTQVNSCDLIPLARTEMSEQEYSYLTASNRRLSAPYNRNNPQNFSQITRSYAFSTSKRHVQTSLWYSQHFSKICWRVKMWSTTGSTTALGNLQLWLNYFAAFFQGTWHTLF